MVQLTSSTRTCEFNFQQTRKRFENASVQHAAPPSTPITRFRTPRVNNKPAPWANTRSPAPPVPRTSNPGLHCGQISNATPKSRSPTAYVQSGLLKPIAPATVKAAHTALMQAKAKLDAGHLITVADAKAMLHDALLLDETSMRLSPKQLQQIGDGLDRLGRPVKQEDFPEDWFQSIDHSIMKFNDGDVLARTPGLRHLPAQLRAIAATLSELPQLPTVPQQRTGPSQRVQFVLVPEREGGGILEDTRYFNTAVARLDVLRTALNSGDEIPSQALRAGLIDLLELGKAMELLSNASQQNIEMSIDAIDRTDYSSSHRSQKSRNSQTNNSYLLGPSDHPYSVLKEVLNLLGKL